MAVSDILMVDACLAAGIVCALFALLSPSEKQGSENPQGESEKK